MAKQIIRLTEGDLHRIIKESVKKILREDTWQDQMHDAVLHGGDFDAIFRRLKKEIPDPKERKRALDKYYLEKDAKWALKNPDMAELDRKYSIGDDDEDFDDVEQEEPKPNRYNGRTPEELEALLQAHWNNI